MLNTPYDHEDELTDWEEEQLDYEKQFNQTHDILHDVGMCQDDFL